MPIEPMNDRLLKITRLVLTLLMALTILVAVTALMTLPILYFRYEEVAAKMAANGIERESIPWVVGLMLGGVLLSVLAFCFLRHLAESSTACRKAIPSSRSTPTASGIWPGWRSRCRLR